MDRQTVSVGQMLSALEALGEPTRLRLAALLAEAELTVTELTSILGQSQPRVSRHLKLMSDAGLIERHREGAWAFFRLRDGGAQAAIVDRVLESLDRHDAIVQSDRARLAEVRADRVKAAEGYFARIADDWDRLRALHVAERDVEDALMAAIGPGPFQTVLDLGTGTGRMLQLLAPRAVRAIGVDSSPAMLSVARANVERSGLRNVQLRHGDVYALPIERNACDIAVVHQVLHYLDEPARALREAARVIRPGGRLFVVDFAPHSHEFLRTEHAHRRLGFADDEIAGLLRDAGLEPLPVRHLSSSDRAAHLTVSIWEARDPRLLTDHLIPSSPRLQEIA